MRKIENVVIHCSDSEWGCAREIRNWHLKRGWDDIGYHFVILNGNPTFKHAPNVVSIPALDGSIECGRYLDEDMFMSKKEIGSHALGLNDSSIGVCLIGVKDFTKFQMTALKNLCRNIIELYEIKIEKFLGHYETASGKEQGKTCPNFDMKEFRVLLKGG